MVIILARNVIKWLFYDKRHQSRFC